MADKEPLPWVVCENCGKLTPEYLQTCFKCGKPRVKPAAVEAPATPPPPAPVTPPKPTGWWDCKACGERDNPPLSESCMRCHAVRPGYEMPAPKTDPTMPSPADASPKTDWRASLKSILAIATVLATGLSIASFFVPALAPLAVIIKSVIAALSGLIGG